MADRIAALEKLLESGRDSALLRFSLGNEYAGVQDFENAAVHFARCVELDRGYSAAWKLLGKSFAQLGRDDAAANAWSQGIEAATKKGDRQAAKEMGVFLRRLQKRTAAGRKSHPEGT